MFLVSCLARFVVTHYNYRKLNYYKGVMSHGCSQSVILGVVGISITVRSRLEVAYVCRLICTNTLYVLS